ncbi:MAG: hypothetical protein CR971_02240 [candidate division SR1 bacterium]|nr:MAG: hypothetical protein CR971_02240 [candidate division SR1 bacterium]
MMNILQTKDKKIIKNQKKGFTLIEIILVVVLIGICLGSIIYYIQSVLNQVQYANQKLIAINLAKEGIESMYYARNTRVLEHPGVDLTIENGKTGKEYTATSERSKCWLALDSEKCLEEHSILDSGKYSIISTEKKQDGKNAKIAVSFQENTDWDFSNGIFTENNKKYALYLSGTQWTTLSGGKTDNLTRYGRFFRKIEGKGIYRKGPNGTDTKLSCSGKYDTTPDCGNNSPKEFRFCSIVTYVPVGEKPLEVKFCALMTNFFPNVNQEG